MQESLAMHRERTAECRLTEENPRRANFSRRGRERIVMILPRASRFTHYRAPSPRLSSPSEWNIHLDRDLTRKIFNVTSSVEPPEVTCSSTMRLFEDKTAEDKSFEEVRKFFSSVEDLRYLRSIILYSNPSMCIYNIRYSENIDFWIFHRDTRFPWQPQALIFTSQNEWLKISHIYSSNFDNFEYKFSKTFVNWRLMTNAEDSFAS